MYIQVNIYVEPSSAFSLSASSRRLKELGIKHGLINQTICIWNQIWPVTKMDRSILLSGQFQKAKAMQQGEIK